LQGLGTSLGGRIPNLHCILFGDFCTDYSNTDQFGDLIV